MARWGVGIVLLALTGAWLYKTYEQPNSPATFVAGEFGEVSLMVELAMSTEDREQGLAGRPTINDNEAMLFIFDKPGMYGFWMKDMLVPIDMFWLDDKRQVVSMVMNVSPDTYPRVFYSSAPARYVLETAAGLGERYQIATGTMLRLQKF